MKILCLIGAFSFGGAEHVMTNLVNYFSQKDEVIYVALFQKEEYAYPIAENVKVINGLGFHNHLQAIRKLKEVIDDNRPDVVLSFMTHINILAILATLGKKIPVIVSERCDPRQTPNKLHHILRFIFYRFAKGYVFQTDEAKSYFSNKIQSKSIVIPNPIFVDSNLLEDRDASVNNEIVAVGRLEDQKNYPMLIDAFNQIQDKYPALKVRIYGEGSKREELTKYISGCGLSDKIELCGVYKDVQRRILHSRMFVMSTNFEGMPNALMEAMALGICCISTNCPVGGPRRLIKNGENGFLIDVGDTDALAQTMEYVINHPELSNKVAENAKKVMDEYNPEKICEQWREYISKVWSK